MERRFHIQNNSKWAEFILEGEKSKRKRRGEDFKREKFNTLKGKYLKA